jgi:hypothetical protein
VAGREAPPRFLRGPTGGSGAAPSLATEYSLARMFSLILFHPAHLKSKSANDVASLWRRPNCRIHCPVSTLSRLSAVASHPLSLVCAAAAPVAKPAAGRRHRRLRGAEDRGGEDEAANCFCVRECCCAILNLRLTVSSKTYGRSNSFTARHPAASPSPSPSPFPFLFLFFPSLSSRWI